MADQATPIRGKVARILSSRELALNIGAKHGVRLGMRFDVLDRKGEGITDPETHEELGSVIRPKVRVKVTLVEDRLSVASTYRTREVNVGGAGLGNLGFSNLFQPEKWVKRTETLKATDHSWEELDEAGSFVKIGDTVQQVVGSDDEDQD